MLLCRSQKISRIIILALLGLLVIIQSGQISAGVKGKRVLTGQDVELAAPLTDSLGIGFTDANEMKKYFFMQLVAWIAIMVFKAIDWWKQARDSSGKDLKEMKQTIMGLSSSVARIEREMVTEHKVIERVRAELEYINRHRG